MLSQNELFYNTTLFKDLKKENLFRKLEENEIELKVVGFFSYDLGSPSESIWSYLNIFSNIDKVMSKYILYPYSFKYKTKDENGAIEEKEQDKGGFI